MKKLLKLLKQPSTWRGLITIASVCGIAITPEQSTAILGAGAAAVGLVEVFRNEKS